MPLAASSPSPKMDPESGANPVIVGETMNSRGQLRVCRPTGGTLTVSGLKKARPPRRATRRDLLIPDDDEQRAEETRSTGGIHHDRGP